MTTHASKRHCGPCGRPIQRRGWASHQQSQQHRFNASQEEEFEVENGVVDLVSDGEEEVVRGCYVDESNKENQAEGEGEEDEADEAYDSDDEEESRWQLRNVATTIDESEDQVLEEFLIEEEEEGGDDDDNDEVDTWQPQEDFDEETVHFFSLSELYQRMNATPIVLDRPEEIPGVTSSPFPPKQEGVQELIDKRSPTLKTSQRGRKPKWTSYDNDEAYHLGCVLVAGHTSESNATEILRAVNSILSASDCPVKIPPTWNLMEKLLRSKLQLPVSFLVFRRSIATKPLTRLALSAYASQEDRRS